MRDARQSVLTSADTTNRRQALLAFVDACQVACGCLEMNGDQSKALVREVMARVLQRASPGAGTSQNFRVARALGYLEERFGDRTIHLASAARHVNITPSHLDKLLKEHTGLTFLQQLRRIRVRHAEQLLVTTTSSIKETAYASGYACTGSFHRDFRRMHGCAPRAWRNRVAMVTSSLTGVISP